jgi:hypothetical protein
MAPATRYLTLTQANLDHCHIYLTECMDLFPEDALGGPNKSAAAARTVQIQCGSQIVTTDIVRKRNFFRQRSWMRRFVLENRLVAGDRVLLEQLGPYSYRISKAEIHQPCVTFNCLSIQQPWVDLILDGKKQVENRSRIWIEAAERIEAGETVTLAVHASSSLSVWNSLSEVQRNDYASTWGPENSTRGAILGMVDVVKFCRPRDLPVELRDHKFAHKNSTNWCWILANPRKLREPFVTKGNTWIFHVDIPRRLLPSDVS